MMSKMVEKAGEKGKDMVMVMLGISSENATEFAMVDDDFEFASFSLFSSIAFNLS